MHVHRLAGGLHHENVGPANVFLDLHIRFAILEARDQSLPARQAKKVADLIAERLVGGSAKNFEPASTRALRLAFRFRPDRLFSGRLLGSSRRNVAMG
jgi:hypothetical protein